MRPLREMLKDFAAALEKAGAVANEIAETQPLEIKLDIDTKAFAKAVYRPEVRRRLDEIAANFKDGGEVVLHGVMEGSRKDRALKEIRHRVEAETDMKEKVRWRLIEKIVESDLTLQHAGQIVDELGDAWCYLLPVHGGAPVLDGDGLPRLSIEKRLGRSDFIEAYHEMLNKALVLDEEERQIGLDHIIKAVLRGEGQ